MLLSYALNQTGIVLRLVLRDANGYGKTGLAFSSAGLIIGTIADDEAASTSYTASGSITSVLVLGTYSAPNAGTCRFSQVDSTNHPGLYELQLANSRFGVANAKSLIVSVTGSSAAFLDVNALIPLVQVDPYTTLATSTIGAVGEPFIVTSGTVDFVRLTSTVDWNRSANVAFNFDKTGYALSNAFNNTICASITSVLTTTPLVEAYTTGALNLTTALYEIAQGIGNINVTGTVLNVQGRNTLTTVAAYVLNSSTTPTSRSRLS